MKLVVTIPAQNEERTIARVVGGVPRRFPGIAEVEILVLDDGSSDATADAAREAGAVVIPILGRPGLGKVFQTGIEAAMRRGGDFVVNIDGDGQFDPADIALLVAPLLEDQADFVTCSRFKDTDLHPVMPRVKYWGNWAVVKIVNSICGGSRFTDVSCGFRAFNREALYRLTLFGKYTYTQECFIDLFSKGLRIVEVPLKVRGVREYGESRVAGSVWRYAANTGPIILRAMRDIRPLKFFGLIGVFMFVLALVAISPVVANYLATKKTHPFQSLITVSGVLVTLAFVMGVLALLADMMARHRRITEELLYLARRRIFGMGQTSAAVEAPVIRSSKRAAPAPAATSMAAAVNGTNGLTRVRPSRIAPSAVMQRSTGFSASDDDESSDEVDHPQRSVAGSANG